MIAQLTKADQLSKIMFENNMRKTSALGKSANNEQKQAATKDAPTTPHFRAESQTQSQDNHEKQENLDHSNNQDKD